MKWACSPIPLSKERNYQAKWNELVVPFLSRIENILLYPVWRFARGYKKKQSYDWFLSYPLSRLKKRTCFQQILFIPCEAVGLWVKRKGPSKDEPFLIPLKRLKKKGCVFDTSFLYTPKRFRTAVAGMKIPSPGPLDDRGDLCDQI